MTTRADVVAARLQLEYVNGVLNELNNYSYLKHRPGHVEPYEGDKSRTFAEVAKKNKQFRLIAQTYFDAGRYSEGARDKAAIRAHEFTTMRVDDE